jgi:hypothetical protein
MEEYETKAHFMYLTANYYPNSRLNLFGSFSFSKSTAELDQVTMPALSAEAAAGLPEMNYDFSHMHTYNDLDFKLMQFSLGFEYEFTPTVTWTADMDYADFTDEAGGYVYGDETGSFMMVRTGVRIGL